MTPESRETFPAVVRHGVTTKNKSQGMLCCWPWASQVALVVKKQPASAGDVRDESLIPGLGRPLE